MRGLVSGVSVVALAMFAACGGEQAQPESSEMAPAAEPAAAPAAEPAAAMMALPEGVTQAMVTEGDAIFHGAGLCQTCHGPDAKGMALAPDLTDGEWLNVTGHNYDEIVTVITNGVAQPKQHPAPMPAKGGANLSDEQVHAVAAYVYSLGS